MPSIRPALILALLSLAACERVTAPEALRAAEKLENDVAEARFTEFYRFLNLAAEGTPSTQGSPAEPLLVIRDGTQETLTGVVIERVYIATGGVGQPVRRRTLLVWPDSAEFGIVARTENDARGVDGSETWDEDYLHPKSHVRLARKRREDSWIGRDGSIRIEPVADEAECPPMISAPTGERPTGHRVTCHAVAFRVNMDVALDRVGDTAVAKLTGIPVRHRLYIPEQQIAGIRFTIQCVEQKGDFLPSAHEPCDAHREAFWRHDSLYAEPLGVRMADYRDTDYPHFERILSKGKPNATYGSSWRWSVWQPDGQLVVRDSVPFPYDERGREKLRLVGQLSSWEVEQFAPGEIRQYLMAARVLLPNVSPDAMLVMRVERDR